MAVSRIHCRAFSRFPAAIKFEFDELLLSAFVVLDVSLVNELCEPCRPHRAGFNEAKNDDVFEFEPKRDRDDDDVVVVLDELGVFRPDVPI